MKNMLKLILIYFSVALLPVAAYSAEKTAEKTAVSANVDKIVSKVQTLLHEKVDAKIEAALVDLISDVKWKDSQAVLKTALSQIKSGKISEIDVKNISKTVMLDAIKDTVSKNMGSNEAAAVNDAITSLVNEGTEGLKDSLQNTTNQLIDKYVAGEDSKAALKQAVSQLRDGKISEIKWGELSKTMVIDGLGLIIDKNMGKEEARHVKSALEGLIRDGKDGMVASLRDSANEMIDKYVKGDEAKASMKNAVDAIANGDISKIDFVDLGSKVAVGGVTDWIDRQDWSDGQKDAAKKVLNGFAEDGLDGLTDAGKEILKEKLTECIGEEKADEIIGEVDKFFDGKDVDWGVIGDGVISIVASKLEKKIIAQFDKLAEKYPALKEIFSTLKKAVSNVFGILTSDMSLSEKLAALAKLAKELLNELIENIKDFLKDQISALLQKFTKIAVELVQKLLDFIKKEIKQVLNEIKAFIGKVNEMIKNLKKVATKVQETVVDVKGVLKPVSGGLKKIMNGDKKRESAPEPAPESVPAY